MKNNNILFVSLAALMLVASHSYACSTTATESNDSEGNANSGVCNNTTISGELSRGDID
ncbi:hypothetical protein [Pseudoalteromonas piscicida]|uniref:hypothetical protein n=1 Tax=Pseudoalteromonas piscicida TaxID=43662 RepID=UPI001FCF89C7|nr:hypothetical protein [Pseudoalteromonas piscicida]